MIFLYRKILKIDSSWILFSGNLGLNLFNFFLVIIMSNYIEPSNYGELRKVFLYANLIFVISSSGFSQALYYFLNKFENELFIPKFIGATRTISVLLSFFCIGLLSIFYHLTFFELIIFIIYILSLVYNSIDYSLFIFEKKIRIYFVINLSMLCVRIFSIIVLLQNKFDIKDYLLCYAITQITTVILNYIVLHKNYFGQIIYKEAKKIYKEILSYSFPLLLSSVLGFLIMNTDKLYLTILNTNTTKFAILSNVSFEPPIIGTIYMSFFTAALPSMIKSFENGDIKELLKKRFEYINLVAILLLPIVVSLIIWNKEYVGIIFGNQYAKNSILFGIFSSISLLRFCSHHDIFLSTNNTKYIPFYQVIEFFCQILLTIILYYYFDITGLILATVVVNYGYIIFVNKKSSKILGVKFVKVLPFKFLIKKIVSLFLIAIIVKYLLFNLLDAKLWIIGLFLYLIVVYFYELKKLNLNNG